jgi:hypothetical protein
MKTKILLTLPALFMGIVVNAQTPLASAVKPLNIDFKNRAYFYAASPQIKKTSGLGGWAESGNYFEKLNTSHRYKPQKLTVHIDTSENEVLAGKFKGFSLYVVNTMSDTVYFTAQDSRLSMKLQALDKDGKWADIEYLPGSWCGNSYHMVFLPSQYYWKFTMPMYEGKQKTKVRAALAYKSSMNEKEEWIYSNEISGSINKGQFSKLPKYEAGGIMDPYTN